VSEQKSCGGSEFEILGHSKPDPRESTGARAPLESYKSAKTPTIQATSDLKIAIALLQIVTAAFQYRKLPLGDHAYQYPAAIRIICNFVCKGLASSTSSTPAVAADSNKQHY
jgi:hypothetical protein